MDPQSALKTSQAYTDMSGLAELKRQARGNADEALVAVAKQFEALFMQMVMKSMRDAGVKSDLFSNDQTKMYTDLYDKQLGIKLAESGGLGLADIIVRQMKANGSLKQNEKSLPMIQSSMSANLVMNKSANTAALKIAENSQLPGMNASVLKINSKLEKIAQQLLATVNSHKIENQTGGNQSPAEFVSSIWQQVKSIAKKLDVNPIGILAQTVLETGWGKHIAKDKFGNSSNNLFGIKTNADWQGKSLNAKTQEFRQGHFVSVKQEFKAYESIEEALQDYSSLLQNSSRYEQVVNSGDNVDQFAKSLQKSGYATDPDYGRKIMSIVHSAQFNDVLKELVN